MSLPPPVPARGRDARQFSAPDSTAQPAAAAAGPSRSRGIDKAVLALPEPSRVRDRDHVQYVAKQPCLICGRQPCDAHHLRFSQNRALGRKVSDEFTVPLCRGHHREVHGCGDEVAWWWKSRIDPIVAARGLWLETHPLSGGPESGLADAENSPTSSAGAGTAAKTDGGKGGRGQEPGSVEFGHDDRVGAISRIAWSTLEVRDLVLAQAAADNCSRCGALRFSELNRSWLLMSVSQLFSESFCLR